MNANEVKELSVRKSISIQKATRILKQEELRDKIKAMDSKTPIETVSSILLELLDMID